jgi:phosphoribosylamine--glycine ligase
VIGDVKENGPTVEPTGSETYASRGVGRREFDAAGAASAVPSPGADRTGPMSPQEGSTVIVVGGGGREHALAWKLAQSPQVGRVVVAPGNAGTARAGGKIANAPVPAGEHAALTALALKEKAALVVVGPEDPLCAGLADRMRDAGLVVFGPGASGARVEGSKIFTKDLLRRYGVPTAAGRAFDSFEALDAYLRDAASFPLVMKADGLAAGKGVVLPDDLQSALAVGREMMEAGKFGEAGRRVLVEELLRGRELSVLIVTDGRTIAVLEAAQDFKRIRDGDEGPNTGGMGAVSPAPAATPELMDAAVKEILVRIVHALGREGIPYRGCLYAGLMATRSGPKVIEFNCRFGDPETQVVLARMKSDLYPVLLGAANAKLNDAPAIEWDARPAVCVVVASAGYPESSSKGEEIRGLDEAERVPGVVVFHAGTSALGDRVVTAGGRVLCVTALGDTTEDARRRAYEAIAKLSFPGMQFRTDIAAPQALTVAPQSGRPR